MITLLETSELLKFKLTDQDAYEWLVSPINGLEARTNLTNELTIFYDNKWWSQTPGIFTSIIEDKTRFRNIRKIGTLIGTKRYYGVHVFASKYSLYSENFDPETKPWICMILPNYYDSSNFIFYKRFTSKDEALEKANLLTSGITSLSDFILFTGN